MGKSFGERLRAGERLLGTMLTLPLPAVAEVLADTGFDWLFVDAEHGPFDLGDIAAVLQAVDRRIFCVVRVPALEAVAIRRTLDLGAEGIIVPQVNTAEQAAAAVEYARYAPDGARGVGLARAHGYGREFSGYLAGANRQVGIVVQAEHAQAVANIDSIVAVRGIDAVLIGPYDLSASLGRTGQLDHPDVVAAIDHVTDRCQAAGMPLGIFGMSAAAVAPYSRRGHTLIVAGVDAVLLSRSAEQLLNEMSS
ncbi:MAG: aldolase/citrate lyase family protein [Gammaproteobacteria bacterium]|jgi:2-keto-3-deoxy-L-rhamnonate aldolase RhmA